MAEGPAGAGAGAGAPREVAKKPWMFFKKNLRSPTDEEKEEIGFILEELAFGFDAHQILPLAKFMGDHPDVQVNAVFHTPQDKSGYYKDMLNAYGSLMLSVHIGPGDKTLQEVMRRGPDPDIISRNGVTIFDALEMEIENEEQRIQEMKDEDPEYEPDEDDLELIKHFRRKIKLAKEYKDLYTSYKSSKNLAAIAETSRNFFGSKGMGENLERRTLSFLTPESGTLPIALSKIRTKVGLPGVVNKSQQGGRKGRTRKARNSRRKSRKVRRRKI